MSAKGAYYNENDAFAAEWLRRLIASGLIAPGEVDERSIEDVRPDDLRGFTQCHFFAGIGGWSYALILAGWPDDRPVWTGSCPCQPFSAAGARKGADDPRHLWPHWRWLVDQCRPPIIFGEQVASKDGRLWLAGVRSDLEALGYAVGAADLCAAGVGAPHIRQRLYWVADAERYAAEPGRPANESAESARATSAGAPVQPRRRSVHSRMADANSRQRERVTAPEGCYDDREASGRQQGNSQSQHGCSSGGQGDGAARGMGDTDSRGLQAGQQAAAPDGHGRSADADGGALGSWSRYVWIPGADGKARRIEPAIEPLADGVPNRVGLLRAYGNAIVPELAAAFIEACLELLP